MEKLKAVENYWNHQPCNIYHSEKPLGSKEYFDEVEKKKYFVEPHIPGFACFARWKNKRVLELGCGIGTDSINFARAGALLTIVELSERSLELCKQRFQVYGLTAIFIKGNIEELPTLLQDHDHFDLIYSFGVIHHTPDPLKVFKALPGLLKENGEVRFMVYSKFSFKIFNLMHLEQNWDMSVMANLIRLNSEAQYGCPVTFTYSLHEIDSLLRSCGLLPSKIWKDHIFRYKIPEYKRHEFVLEEAFQNMKEEDYIEMTKELGWHTLVIASKSQ